MRETGCSGALGLPTEEDEDVEGIVWTGHRAWKRGVEVRGDKRGVVTVSVSTFVPKPHTPFQWAAMNTYDEVRRKQRLLRDAARRARVKLKVHDSKGSWLEGVLARGDRRLAKVLSDAFDHGARQSRPTSGSAKKATATPASSSAGTGIPIRRPRRVTVGRTRSSRGLPGRPRSGRTR